MDTAIVGVGFLNLIQTVNPMSLDPTMLRMVRLLRLVRVLKVLRKFAAFDSLFLLVRSLQASYNALVWSFMLLATLQIVTGMFLAQMLSGYFGSSEEANLEKQ